jgi:hypothetical protein
MVGRRMWWEGAREDVVGGREGARKGRKGERGKFAVGRGWKGIIEMKEQGGDCSKCKKSAVGVIFRVKRPTSSERRPKGIVIAGRIQTWMHSTAEKEAGGGREDGFKGTIPTRRVTSQ